MQRLVNHGSRPNAAAVLIANQHWRDISKTRSAAVQLLKRNQRKFSAQLSDVLNRTGRAKLLEFKRRKSTLDGSVNGIRFEQISKASAPV